MFADIATGKTAGADVVFLIALIVAGVAAVIYAMSKNLGGLALSVALGLVAFGLLLQ